MKLRIDLPKTAQCVSNIWTQALGFPYQASEKSFLSQETKRMLYPTFSSQVKSIINIVKERWKKKDWMHRLNVDPHLIHFFKDTTATEAPWSHLSIHDLCSWKYGVSSIHWDHGACEWIKKIHAECMPTLSCHLHIVSQCPTSTEIQWTQDAWEFSKTQSEYEVNTLYLR